MNYINKRQFNSIMKNAFGWGDAKRKICIAIGVEYKWEYELPEYINKWIREYRGIL